MIDGDILILENVFGLDRFISVLNEKERFFNGDFFTIKYCLLAVGTDQKRIYEKALSKIVEPQTKIKSLSIKDYINENQEGIKKIEQFLSKNNHFISWLAKLQIYEISKNNLDDKNIEQNFHKVLKVQDELLPKDEDPFANFK